MKKKTTFLAIGFLLAALLNAFGQLAITSQPQSATNLAGTSATFSVAITGTPPFAYQWLFNSSIPLAGATNADLILTNVQSFNAGGYSVVVTNVEGIVTSVEATLIVLTPPRITRQPANQTASLFANAAFRVIATGDAPLSYQWRFKNADLLGMTNSILTVTNVQRSDAGNYNVVVTNPSGSITSQAATLTITAFNSIYCFGFSWTDTHNCGSLDPSSYWNNRFSNGPLWPDFLSTNLGLAYVAANNYAVCAATSSDLLNQVTSNFRAPPEPELSIYFLWVGGTEFLRALRSDPAGLGYLAVTNEVGWSRLIQTAILNNSNAVNRLYSKGSRAIVLQAQMDLSKFPESIRSFGTNSVGLSKFSEYIARFNSAFIDAMNTYSQTRSDLRIVFVDVFSKLNEVLANPAQYDFTKTTIDALDDTSLLNKTFTGPGADYVFWDHLHGTTKLHELIAAWNLEALTNSILENLDVTIANSLPNIGMNRLQIGRDYTLQSSPDLSHWQDVHTFPAAAGTNLWSSPTTGISANFYRLTWRP